MCGPYQRANLFAATNPLITMGPGGSEMYWSDVFNWNTGPHGEIVSGGARILKGTAEVMVQVMDIVIGSAPIAG